MGATQAWQQIQVPQEEFSRRCDRLHQVPATQVHTSGREGEEENEEEQEQRAASRQIGQEAAVKGFPLTWPKRHLSSQPRHVSTSTAVAFHQNGRTEAMPSYKHIFDFQETGR